jgi:hypothetical protein
MVNPRCSEGIATIAAELLAATREFAVAGC